MQEQATEEQFSAPDDVDPAEWDAWRAIRDKAAARTFGPDHELGTISVGRP